MNKIIECVPNFSEGREKTIIKAIAEAITTSEGCVLLDVDAGSSTNRTVYTFVGNPKSVIEGALAAARVAKEKIDMRTHSGEHPRFGAMDVCPFVPVANVSMEECVEVSNIFAQKAAKELDVPFFLYEEASEREYRKKLSDIRKGEYEGLKKRLRNDKWKPDFGPHEFRPSWGATATGARNFLIAYNVNIIGTPNQAHRIALNLREAGRGADNPGRLKGVKGMGWFVKEYNMAQVTVNLTDFRVTPPHILFEEVKKEAATLNLGVAGSEIVGAIPLEPLLMAAEYYIAKENLFIYQEDQKIRLAMERLGLNSISSFIPSEKIIDYRVAVSPTEPLAAMSTRQFIEEIGSRSSAPGGGSASVTIAAMGVALGAMVAKLTHGVRKFEKVEAHMREVIPTLHELISQLIPMIDADTSAFNDFLVGVRMPKETKAEKRERTEKMQEGLKTATEIPLQTMRLADQAWNALLDVARYGNQASKSDTQVGAKALETGIWGAYQNVLINMKEIQDTDFTTRTHDEADKLMQRAHHKCAKIQLILEKIP